MDRSGDINFGAKTKAELIQKVENKIAQIRNEKGCTDESFYKERLKMAESFLCRIKKANFPELKTSDGWELFAEINDTRADLFLQLIEKENSIALKDEDYLYTIKEIYKLIEV